MQEGSAPKDLSIHDPADEDRVIAGRYRVPLLADDVRDHAVEKWRFVGPSAIANALETRRGIPGELSRERFLILGQYVDDERRCSAQVCVESVIVVHAQEQEWRLE